ncbi:MAG TPA: DUF2752 domain-containing protein [Thermoanaerobaculia bacterium]|nr:DUF2752 domain-containing protein [Thermoanaerobaculia bacterium]
MRAISATTKVRPAFLWAAAGLLGLAGLVVLHLWAPPDDPRLAICLSRRLLGIPCPTCGMTRALAHLAKGEWRAALALHPLAPLVLVELVLGWMLWGWKAWGSVLAGRLPRVWSRLDLVLAANGALFCALWLGRLASGTLPR